MSVEMVSERVSYVHCNFCNTILVVGVPCSNLLTIATVRCERCSSLLSVNLAGSLPQSLHLQDFQKHKPLGTIDLPFKEIGSSSKCKRLCPMSTDDEATKTSPIRPPEKRQRVPSAYNRFIKEEIQRIKASNPEISHRQAFSTAAKNWAHYPDIHFGMKMEASPPTKTTDTKTTTMTATTGDISCKSLAFY